MGELPAASSNLFAIAVAIEGIYVLLFALTLKIPGVRFWPPPGFWSWQFFIAGSRGSPAWDMPTQPDIKRRRKKINFFPQKTTLALEGGLVARIPGSKTDPLPKKSHGFPSAGVVS